MNTQVSTTAARLNSTFVKPLGFYISGFQSLQNVQYYYLFLSVAYLGTIMANILLMTVIVYAENLHTPKYIAVFMLSVVDISYSSSFIPRYVLSFAFNFNFIPYEACLAQLFFVHYFCAMESISLAVLAYDRLMAICFPLHCSSIHTNKRMILIIGITWMVAFMFVITAVIFMTRLSFCKSVFINSYFCDHGPMYVLACNDNSANRTIAYSFIAIIIVIPLIFIIITYTCIIVAVLKIASASGRLKTFKTCTTHLILVAIFYLPLLLMYFVIIWANEKIDTDARILNTSLSATLPPLLNPIVYTLKTNEITEQIKKMFFRSVISPIK
ncbi:olfactory receptor 24-like [Erpetoichthys calabaricus]|uniref:olfactory receptor 24-like n=1 Tax=Erpetoichthys calabaricus TaxID=27687 RepID=UPI00109FB740|nr:olfactory receptor 24-like [Erpetoichthys calabaricus]